VASINKIKSSAKIASWRTVFIQYKARCEKRKSWKDKMSRVKEIEANLMARDGAAQSSGDEDTPDAEVTAPEQEKTAPEQKKTAPEQKKTAPEQKKKSAPRMVVEEKEDLLSEEEMAEEEEMEDYVSDEEGGGVGLAAGDDLDGYELGGFSSDEEEAADVETLELLLSAERPKKEAAVAKKPLLVEAKAGGKMVIKQFDLEEIKGLAEIPIQAREGADEEADEGQSVVVSSTEDEEEAAGSGGEQVTAKKRKKKKFAIGEDPFFLDSNGNEIVNSEFDLEREKFR